ncbi:alpha/beta hydrolase [Paenibacillus ottowii]
MKEDMIQIHSQDGVLEGRLAWPACTEQEVPCVILLHPWGAWDMDGSHPADMSVDDQPVRMFLQLRDAIADKGMSVLRYNSRFVPASNDSAVDYQRRTFSGLVEDACAAVDLVRNTDGVQAEAIWLLGISLGTEVAIAASEKAPILKGLVLMSTIGENYLYRRYYMDVERKLQWLWEQRLVEKDGTVKVEALRELDLPRWGWWDHLEEELQTLESASYEQIASILKLHYDKNLARDLQLGNEEAPSQFWQEWISNEPAYKRITQFTGPICIIQASDDNATPIREAYLLKNALKDRSNVSFTVFDQLGHIFSPRRGDARRTYGPIASEVLSFLTHYLEENN